MTNGTAIKRPWYKHWWGILVMLFLALIAVCLIYFTQQFIKFYRLAKAGKTSTAEVAFLDKFTTSDRLRTHFASADETDLDLTTADDPSFGSNDAKVTIVEFADFQCPYSREESFVIRELATKYVDKIKVIYRDFPIDELHPQARLAAEAGGCANEQGNFWALHDKMFANQDRLSRDDLVGYAEQVGLDKEKFSACLDSGKFKDEVEEDWQAGHNAGVRGTPTFFINGKRIEGAIPRDVFEQILKVVTL